MDLTVVRQTIEPGGTGDPPPVAGLGTPDHISAETVAENIVRGNLFQVVDEVDRQLSEAGEPPIKREGARSDIWILMDFGCVVVHIFTDEARKFYNLERLWADSEEVPLSSLLSP